MDTKTRKLNARKKWLEIYKKYKNVSLVARKCGIPRSTLYRWIQRYDKDGIEGLKDISQKPKKLAKQKITVSLENLILTIRNEYKFGPQRISTHLLREHNIELSAPTIWRVLQKNNIKPLKRYRPSKQFQGSVAIPSLSDIISDHVSDRRARNNQFQGQAFCERSNLDAGPLVPGIFIKLS